MLALRAICTTSYQPFSSHGVCLVNILRRQYFARNCPKSSVDSCKNEEKEKKFEDLTDILREFDFPLYKTWKSCFLERYVKEELERMSPDQFNQEYIKDLTNLCNKYVFILELSSLKSASDNDEFGLSLGDHISLDTAITGLKNLFEFSVCFNEGNLGSNFSWDKMKTSERDCKLLSQGLENGNLKILRILRSDIDCEKLKVILRPLTHNRNLRILDLSHCKIGNEGVKDITKLLQEHPTLNTVILTNNLIGAAGAEELASYLQGRGNEEGLKHLNLKLNNIGDEGGRHFAAALARGSKCLIQLCLAACGITRECIALSNSLKINNTLEKLDLCSNDFGEEYGQNILKDIKQNKCIMHLDLRMCNISAEIRSQIDKILSENWKIRRGELICPPNTYTMPYKMF